jgi:hypothetical protein
VRRASARRQRIAWACGVRAELIKLEMAAASSSSSAGGSPAHTGSPAGAGGGGQPYGHHRSRFGDTTLTKVFVGGLAWETPSEGLREHFQGYGEILEAVVITDRETGRSKGYGFVSHLFSLSLIGIEFARLISDRILLRTGDFPGPGGGAASGAEPEPGDRRPARQLQHCVHGTAAARAAER